MNAAPRGVLQRLASRALGLESASRLRAAGAGVPGAATPALASELESQVEVFEGPGPGEARTMSPSSAAPAKAATRAGLIEPPAASAPAAPVMRQGARQAREIAQPAPHPPPHPSRAEAAAAPTPAAPPAAQRAMRSTASHPASAAPVDSAEGTSAMPQPLLPLLSRSRQPLANGHYPTGQMASAVSASARRGATPWRSNDAQAASPAQERPVEVHVSIGRVELGLPPVRLAGGPSAAVAPSRSPTLSLAEYLQASSSREGHGRRGSRG